jgi:hypothetical protein
MLLRLILLYAEHKIFQINHKIRRLKYGVALECSCGVYSCDEPFYAGDEWELIEIRRMLEAQ